MRKLGRIARLFRRHPAPASPAAFTDVLQRPVGGNMVGPVIRDYLANQGAHYKGRGLDLAGDYHQAHETMPGWH